MAKFVLSKMLSTMALATAVISTQVSAKPSDNTLSVAFQQQIVNLDYLYTTSQEHIVVSDLTDDRLFEVDPISGDIKPALALSYKMINDKTFDVFLRKGVKFHDGSSFSAADVVYTYNWILNPESNTRAAGTIERWLKKVEKIDEYTVRFHMKAVYPLAIRDIARRVPIRKNNAYLVKGKPDRSAQALALVGLGPYKVASFKPGQKAVLERFSQYYKDSPKGLPRMNQIIIRTIPDWGTQQAELLTGGIDWTYDMPLDVAEIMETPGKVKYTSGPSLRTSFVVLDARQTPDNPLRDARVRRAFNHAINTPEITKYLVGGAAHVLKAACSPVQFGCTSEVQQYPYDPKKAAQLLAEAKYDKKVPLELWAYRDRSVAEAVVADLTKAGFNVNLRYAQLASLDKARAQGKIHAYIGSWASGATADTAMIARIHFGDTDRNLSNNPKVKELVFAAEETNDPNRRKALYKEALQIIANQAYWAPLFAYSVNYLMHPKLDFPASADGLPRLYLASWKK